MHTTSELMAWDKQYLWHPFTQMKDWIEEQQLIIEKGEGVFLYDTDGNKYYDGVSSLWVNVHGHNRKELNEALKEQADKISHSTFLGLSNVPATILAKKLIEITPDSLNRVFYSDSGSTSVEIALKIAYQYFQQNDQHKKKKFIKFVNAYHGDTLGSVSVGGIDLFHKVYRAMLFETISVPYPSYYSEGNGLSEEEYHARCLNELKKVIEENKDEVAALVVEPLVQGAAGMNMMPHGFLTEIRKLTSEHNILMIADEVATGFGKTGEMFACNHENIEPDIMCMAKGISAGYLPLAATLTSEKVFEGFLGSFEDKKTFYHGHTYTGNQLACAVAIESLKLFEKDNIIANVQNNSIYIEERLKEFAKLTHVGDTRQCGIMVGLELMQETVSKEAYPIEKRIGHKVCMLARKYGLIIRPLGDVLVLMPPLCITKEQLQEMLDITLRCIKEITEN